MDDIMNMFGWYNWACTEKQYLYAYKNFSKRADKEMQKVENKLDEIFTSHTTAIKKVWQFSNWEWVYELV